MNTQVKLVFLHLSTLSHALHDIAYVCGLCYNIWKTSGFYPVSLVSFSCLAFAYNWSDTKTSTVNWYRVCHVPIYIVWFLCAHTLYQGLVQYSHCNFLQTHLMRVVKYTSTRLRKFESHEHYPTWGILLLLCCTRALIIHFKKMWVATMHACVNLDISCAIANMWVCIAS